MKKKINVLVPQIQPDSVPFTDGDGFKRWRSFKNALTTIRLFQSPISKRLNSPDELTMSRVKSYQKNLQKSESSKNFNDALRNIQIQQTLFKYIEQGASNEKIEEILNKDPKKYYYDSKSQLSLINKKNQKGQTPLYVAAQQGHVELCRFLIDKGADPKISVTINGIEETPLEVAFRWKHQKVVHLLQNLYN